MQNRGRGSKPKCRRKLERGNQRRSVAGRAEGPPLAGPPGPRLENKGSAPHDRTGPSARNCGRSCGGFSTSDLSGWWVFAQLWSPGSRTGHEDPAVALWVWGLSENEDTAFKGRGRGNRPTGST